MRLSSFLAVIVALLIVMAILAWATHPVLPARNSQRTAAAAAKDEHQPDASGIYASNPFPETSPDAPRPQAEPDAVQYHFGYLAAGLPGKHTFSIRNSGNAPLKLAVGPRTCKCTIGSLTAEEIPPGATVNVEVEWHPPEVASNFSQSATIWTNDPDNRKIDFIVEGSVVPALVLAPAGLWWLGGVSESNPTTVRGTLSSQLLESFHISNITSSMPQVQVTAEPLSPRELQQQQAKSGYALNCVVQATMPIGAFSAAVTVVTDVPDASEVRFQVSGARSGPFSMIGPGWTPFNQIVDLKRFPAAEGKTSELSLFVESDQPVEFSAPVIEPPILDVSLEPDDAIPVSEKQRFKVTIRIPPGVAAERYARESAVQVTLHSTPPDSETYVFHVAFQAD